MIYHILKINATKITTVMSHPTIPGQRRQVCLDLRGCCFIADCGHWNTQEKTRETNEALIQFLDDTKLPGAKIQGSRVSQWPIQQLNYPHPPEPLKSQTPLKRRSFQEKSNFSQNCIFTI